MTVDQLQVHVSDLSPLRRTLGFDCLSEGCPRRATLQVEIQMYTARFELPACADHAEMVRRGWRLGVGQESSGFGNV